MEKRASGLVAPMPLKQDGWNMPRVITFILTEECNFRCTYCYLVHKNNKCRMTFDVAKAAIDYFLEHREIFSDEKVALDFIGGEPLLEVELIEQILKYMRKRTYELNHPWFTNMDAGITTNGANYGTEKVQRFVKRYREMVGISITIDGPKHVQDTARVFPDGSGTYDAIIDNVMLWQEQYPGLATKVTIAHENLPYLAESILHIFDLGIKEIHSNVVFEDSWKPGDPELLEEQLNTLCDEMIKRDIWRDHSSSFFSSSIGQPFNPANDGNWCGAGKMLAIDYLGNFYPCNRFLGFSLEKRKARSCGNIHDGLNLNIVRPFLALTYTSQSPNKCIECDVATGCAWCQGFNYDDAKTSTIYQRATHICELHKARVRANERYFRKIDELLEKETK